MDRKKNIMSLAMDEEMQEALNKVFREQGYTSRSAFVRDMVRKFVLNRVTVVEHEEETIPVILRIPANLRGNREALESWMAVKLDAITKALS